MNVMETPRMMTFDVGRMAEAVADARKDGLVLDCARLVCVHYSRMVEHFAALEGRPVSSHNNKTLMLEGADIWCRAWFSDTPRAGAGRTSDPYEIITHVMRPWYEALSLDDPSRYRMSHMSPPPIYTGSPEDATCVMLGMCACLDVGAIRIKLGNRGGEPRRAWGKVQADGKWYDSDVNDAGLVLGEHGKFDSYEEIEVPL